MFHIIVKNNYEEVSAEAYKVMKETVTGKENPVLGLATGSSPIGLYKNMIADYEAGKTTYANCTTFNLDEYIGLPKDHEQSYWAFMHENLFNHINVPEERIHIPDGTAADEEAAAKAYEDELKKYTVDLQVLGIGSDGHIGFNEPGAPFDSVTHIMPLTEQTRKDNARFFDGDINQVPKYAITMGLGSIMRSRKILLIATTEHKAKAIFGMIQGPKTVNCPASVLQDHPDVYVIVDQGAASLLK